MRCESLAGLTRFDVFYSEEEQSVFRLSSKSHWDVPVQIAGKSIHLLCSHPTPPIFDGPEGANGRRNFDELRFWSDYLTGGESAAWIHDDNDLAGGLPQAESYVILGDLNADPVRCETACGRAPISWVLGHPRVFDPQPQSAGSLVSENPRKLNGFLPFKTNRFGRLDYVLPSRDLNVSGSGVHWPALGLPAAKKAQIASDHRLVWVDPTGREVPSESSLDGNWPAQNLSPKPRHAGKLVDPQLKAVGEHGPP